MVSFSVECIIAYFRSENEKLKRIYNYQKHAQQWSTVNGKATVIEVPVEVAWTKQWELFTFHANELFHDEELGLQSAIGIIQSKFREISQIQRSLNHLVNYTATTSIDPALFHRVYTATTNTFSELGHSLQNLGGGLLNGFYQALINIAVTIALILGGIIILGIIILYCKYKAFQKIQPCRISRKKHRNKGKTTTTNDGQDTAESIELDELTPSGSRPTNGHHDKMPEAMVVKLAKRQKTKPIEWDDH